MATIKARAPARRGRLAVASRTIAATIGGYAVAALLAIALGAALPTNPATATIVATLIGLLAMPVVAMASFRARTAGRAWGGILGAALFCAAVALAGGWRP